MLRSSTLLLIGLSCLSFLAVQVTCIERIDCGKVLHNRGNNTYHFTVVNYCTGNHLFESDIKTTKVQEDYISSHHYTNNTRRRRKRAAASIVDLWQDYPQGNNYIVPYEIGANISILVLDALESAIKEYNRYTCLRLKPRTSEKNYLEFVGLGGCWSYVGKHGDKQELSLGDGCDSVGTVVHEILHALGFWHEQSRPDRDDHLLIVYDNVKSENTHNFDKYTTQKINSLRSPYDAASIMQYGGYAFTKNGQPTIIDRETQRPTEWADEWSHHDVEQLNRIYGCTIKDEKTCDASTLPKIEGNGKLTPLKKNYQPQEKVKLTCDRGYSPDSSEFSTCKNRAFDKQQFICKKDECEDTKDDCQRLKDQGYCSTKTTLMEIKCAKTCELCGKCVSLPPVEGEGWIDPYIHVYSKNETVLLNCIDGWRPYSEVEAVCLGEFWTVDKFICVPGEKRNCSELPYLIGDGTIYPEQDIYRNGDVIELRCGNNSVPMEDEIAVCNNGNFQPDVFICDEMVHSTSCDVFMLPFIEGPGYFFPEKEMYEEEEQVELHCANGTIPLINDFSVCIEGFFVPSHFACVSPITNSSCAELPYIDGVGDFEPRKHQYDQDDEIKLVCADGYKPFEDTSSVCLQGHFYPDFLICEKLEPNPGCDNNTLPFLNGEGKFFPQKEYYVEGEVVTLECAEGYEAEVNGAIAFCNSGFFDPFLAACRKRKCHKDALPFVDGDGFVAPVKEEYKEGDMVALMCANGLSPGREEMATCKEGYFIPDTMFCLPATCSNDTLPYVEGNGRLEPVKEVYGEEESVHLVCDEGFEPHYENSSQCYVGEFFPLVLSCVRKIIDGCSVLDLPVIIGPGELTNVKEHYKPGEKVQLVCYSGYGVKKFVNEAECFQNQFFPPMLKCRKIAERKCFDRESRCERLAKIGRCREEKIKRRCRISCGVCTK